MDIRHKQQRSFIVQSSSFQRLLVVFLPDVFIQRFGSHARGERGFAFHPFLQDMVKEIASARLAPGNFASHSINAASPKE
jgi:hypothetical protein